LLPGNEFGDVMEIRMRAVLSTIGSRGEAQPMVALAVALNNAGHDAVVCAPPDFQQWAQSLGVRYVPVGPWLRGTARQPTGTVPTAQQRRDMIEGTVAEQFAALGSAAEAGCDVVVGGGGLAIAAPSIAEKYGARYVYAAFAPVTLPSPHHAPPVFAMLGETRDDSDPQIAALWRDDAQRWNTQWRAPLNGQRRKLGLADVDDVRSHLFTERPWLAADPVIAPWPQPSELRVLQTGAWLLDDHRPLDDQLEEFLAAGQAPVYVGMGSVRAPEGLTAAVLTAARRVGLRVVIARGWADLRADDQHDTLVVGEVNQQRLFGRVAAVVHHGGAGTTTTAAAAGVPQIVIPQMFDQPYFAGRVERLGIGTALRDHPTPTSLSAALQRARTESVTTRTASVATQIRNDGAQYAARLLHQLVNGSSDV
jgi:vancomycin aglycone glucosyltransferase